MPFAGQPRLIFCFQGPPCPLYILKVEEVGMNSKVLFNISLLQWFNIKGSILIHLIVLKCLSHSILNS